MATGARDLSEAERALLTRILSNTSGSAQELVAQIPNAFVVGGIPTLLDLSVTDSRRASMPDGPVPVRTFVEGDGQELKGEIIVWVTNGYLSALEFAWFTDERPVGLPSPDRLRVTSS